LGALDGKTAVITGGLRGIGRATAERFRAEGARVVVIDRDVAEERDDEVRADVTDAADVDRAFTRGIGADGVDICLANAGRTMLAPFLEADLRDWDRIMRVNLLGVVHTFHAAARRMVAQGRGGRLLAASSVAGLRGEAGASSYCAAKAGVVSLVQSLALELAPHSITVNAVAPGEIDTEMHAALMSEWAASEGRSADEVRSEFLDARVPARRMVRPEEVAGVYLFLASSEAAYITGEVIRIDGGELLT
jgi:NAD(P)-dependent dehydrogenase (short-subunit alcohol dehydrogenase family)